MANPTIGATTPRIQYTATASQTVFTVPFEFLANADLAVYVNGTLKTLTTDYTLTGANTTGGGTLTFVTGRTAGDIVTILGNLAYSRDTNKYTKYGLLPAEVLEADFDAMQVQAKQLARDGQFAVRAPLTDTGSPSMTLPAVATRASKALGFDASGNPTVSASSLADIDTATQIVNTIGAAPAGSAANVSYTPAGTGAVSTNVQTKLRETMSVKDFGAVGDGVTDDTAAIQAALNAVSTGGHLIFPLGSYVCDNSLALTGKSNIRIVGEGATLLLKSSVTTTGYALTFTSCTDITITGLRFSRRQSTTTGANMSAIALLDSKRVTVSECYFYECFYGVAISANTVDCTDIKVIGCISIGTLSYSASNESNNLLQGPLVYTQSVTGAVRNVLVSDCLADKVYHLILTSPFSERVTVANNQVRSSHDSSIYLRSAGSVVQGNVVTDAGKDAIKLLTGSPTSDYKRNLVSGNSIYGAGLNKADGGVLISVDSSDTTVVGNSLESTTATIAAAGQNCVFVSNSYVEVVGNAIYGRTSTSIGVAVRTDLGDINSIRIESNVFHMSNRYAIAFTPTSSRYIKNAAIKNNTINGASVAMYLSIGVDTEWFEDIEIVGNKITNSVEGVQLRGALRPVIKDNILGSNTGSFFFRLGGMTGTVLENNLMDASATYRNISGATPTYYRRGNNLRAGVDQDAFVTLTANDTSPSVSGARSIKTANTIATTITALDDGYAGMTVVVLINDANTTVDFTGTTLKGNGGADWVATLNDHMTCTFDGTNWYCDVSNN